MAKQRYELWGESIREIGVLLLVFAPLDRILKLDRAHWVWLTVAVGIGLALIEIGVVLESNGQKQ